MLSVLLLVLFPFLYLFHTRLALGALLVAIVLAYVDRVKRETGRAHTRAEERPMKPWKDPWGTGAS